MSGTTLETVVDAVATVAVVAVSVAVPVAIIVFKGRYVRRLSTRRHLRALARQFRDRNFALLRRPPFVFISDEAEDDLRVRIERTVPWIAEGLRIAYFRRSPRATIDVWMFTDRGCYEWCMKTLLPAWPVRQGGGRFIPAWNAVVADISDGNGVLVHEIVHALVHANFRRCPVWLNEGLASLYNRCNREDGEVRGHLDGSLSRVQTAIAMRRTVPFKRLCALPYAHFHPEIDPHGEDRNYLQSRYLCYYLQEKAS